LQHPKIQKYSNYQAIIWVLQGKYRKNEPLATPNLQKIYAGYQTVKVFFKKSAENKRNLR
jgi:hypothetical protein